MSVLHVRFKKHSSDWIFCCPQHHPNIKTHFHLNVIFKISLSDVLCLCICKHYVEIVVKIILIYNETRIRADNKRGQ